MLNFNEKKAIETKMYQVVIGNHVVKMSEADTQTIINTICEMGYSFSETKARAKSEPKSKKSQPLAEAPVDVEAKKAAKKHNDRLRLESLGKKVWDDDVCTIIFTKDGDYRLYITTPIKKVRVAVKMSAKEYNAKWTGNYDKGEIHWTFPSRKEAEEFAKARKEYDSKKERA